MVSSAIGNRLNFSHFVHRRGVYSVYLGLHPYLPNGSRSGLEIKMEFHEGALLLSTLLALYRYYFAFSLLSVSLMLSIFLCPQHFVVQLGEHMTKTVCAKIYPPVAGSY